MSKISYLTQKLVNSFPRNTNIREYEFSNGKLLLNPSAVDLSLIQTAAFKAIKDLYPSTSTRSAVHSVFEMGQVKGTPEKETVMQVTGYVGSILVEEELYLYTEPTLFYNSVFTETPKHLVQIDAGLPYVSGVCVPSSYITEVGLGYTYYGNTVSDLIFIVTGSYGNSLLVGGSYQNIKIKGFTKSNPLEEQEESLIVLNDGSYRSRVDWRYINNITFFNMKNDVVFYQTHAFNLEDRSLNNEWFLSDSRSSEYYNDGLGWNTEASGFYLHKNLVTPVDGVVKDPDYVFYIKGVATTGEASSINDFDVVPMAMKMAVLNEGFISYYDLEKGVPSGVTDRKLGSRYECPYNLVFEQYDYDNITVKLQNKFIKNPFDHLFVLKVRYPSGEEKLIDSNGFIRSDTGEYFDFKDYDELFLFEILEKGLYTFRICYYDTETRSFKEHCMHYNKESKEPIYSIYVGDYQGIRYLDNETVLLRYGSEYTVARTINPKLLLAGGILYSYGIQPTHIAYQGSYLDWDLSYTPQKINNTILYTF